MGKLKTLVEKGITKIAMDSAQRNVNQSCFIVVYQEKMPEEARKLRKI